MTITNAIGALILSLFHAGPQVSVNLSNAAPLVLTPQTTTSSNVSVYGVNYVQTNFNSCLAGSHYVMTAQNGFVVSNTPDNTNILNQLSDGSLGFVSTGTSTVRTVSVDAKGEVYGAFQQISSASNTQQTVSYTFASFDGNSAAQNVYTGTTAFATGSYSPSAAAFWTTRSLSALATNFVRNPSCALNSYSGLCAIPAAHSMVQGASYWYQGPATAISPRHVYFAAHFPPPPPPARFFYVDLNNNVVVRSVVETTNVIPDSDICIGILDSDLPGSIGFLKVLPANAWSTYLRSAVYTNWGFADQFKAKFTLAIFPTQFQSAHVLDLNQANGYVVAPGSQQWAPGWGSAVIAGDSGSPILLLINKQLVLVSAWTSPVSGTDIASHEPDINDAMAKLSQRHGATVYALTTVDLSTFNTY